MDLRKIAVNVVVAVAAVSAVAVPVLGLRGAIDGHAASQAQARLQSITDRALIHAESALVEAGDALSLAAARTGNACDDEVRGILAEVAARTGSVRDVVVFDRAGNPCRTAEALGEPALPNHWRAVRGANLAVGLADPDAHGRSMGMVRTSEPDGRTLLALLVPDALRLDIVPTEWRGDAIGEVTLDDGTPVGPLPHRGLDAGERFIPDGRMVEAAATSANFPIRIVLKLPHVVAGEQLAPIRGAITIGGLVLGGALLLLILQLLRRPATVETAIGRGLRRREFVPYYQPVFAVSTGELVGCEVLIRWVKADGTVVSPGAFIQKAEESGLAVPMTLQLMEKLRDEMAPFYAGRPKLKLAVNLFADHFNDLSTVEDIRRIFQDGPIRYTQLVFEVTERYPLPNLNRARVAITGLQELGCRVALDDAGTGHGGLAYLQKLGMDQIKIDKLFIDTISEQSAAAPIVDSLIELARSMNMEVVAEGVETQAQFAYLRSRGVDFAQGFLFSKPLPGETYGQLIEAMLPLDDAEPLRDAA